MVRQGVCTAFGVAAQMGAGGAANKGRSGSRSTCDNVHNSVRHHTLLLKLPPNSFFHKRREGCQARRAAACDAVPREPCSCSSRVKAHTHPASSVNLWGRETGPCAGESSCKCVRSSASSLPHDQAVWLGCSNKEGGEAPRAAALSKLASNSACFPPALQDGMQEQRRLVGMGRRWG